MCVAPFEPHSKVKPSWRSSSSCSVPAAGAAVTAYATCQKQYHLDAAIVNYVQVSLAEFRYFSNRSALRTGGNHMCRNPDLNACDNGAAAWL